MHDEPQQLQPTNPLPVTTVDLLEEGIRRVDIDDGRRILGLSVAELRRLAEDFDTAWRRHPAGTKRTLTELLGVQEREPLLWNRSLDLTAARVIGPSSFGVAGRSRPLRFH